MSGLLYSQQASKDITILKMGKVRIRNVSMVKEQWQKAHGWTGSGFSFCSIGEAEGAWMDPERGWRVEVKPTLSGTRGKGLRVVAMLSQ